MKTLSDQRVEFVGSILFPYKEAYYHEEWVKNEFDKIKLSLQANASEKRKIIEVNKAIAIINFMIGDKLK